METARRHDVVVLRRRQRATLDDVVELLEGIGVILMAISAQLDRISRHITGDDDEEADA